MLSICTTIKNRSRVHTDNGTLFLFPNAIKSLASSLRLNDDVELVIADWESTDWPLREWIEDCIPHIPIHISTISGREDFSAGLGRNVAAKHASGDLLFFMDADMLVNRAVIEYGLKVAKNGAYYPTVIYKLDNDKDIIHEGGGNVFMTPELLKQAGGWPEYYKHGFEDTDLCAKITEISPIITNDKISIFHQWHPQTNIFKNRHASNEADKLSAIEETRRKHQKQSENNQKAIELAIANSITSNPNTTHSGLNSPVLADNRGLRV
jgi:glycosyltransferase involved in cell wall biosynthesis